MERFERLSERIKTVSDLKTLLKTMRALSAVSIHHFERAALDLQAYKDTILDAARILEAEIAQALSAGASIAGAHLLVVAGPERGFCGRHHEQLADTICEQRHSSPPRLIYALGRRLIDALEDRQIRVDLALPLPGTVDGIDTVVGDLLDHIADVNFGEDARRIMGLYMLRRRAQNLDRQSSQIWPADLKDLIRPHGETERSRCIAKVMGDRRWIARAVLRQLLRIGLTEIVIQAMVAEHGARLTGLHATDRNITEHLTHLTGDLNRYRQDMITSELMEIRSGYLLTVADT